MAWNAKTMWRTCLHKKAYRTRDYALGIAKKIKEERGAGIVCISMPFMRSLSFNKKRKRKRV